MNFYLMYKYMIYNNWLHYNNNFDVENIMDHLMTKSFLYYTSVVDDWWVESSLDRG